MKTVIRVVMLGLMLAGPVFAQTELVYYSKPNPVTGGEWYKIGFWAKTIGVPDSAAYIPAFAELDRQDERVNMTYFFHSGQNTPAQWGSNLRDTFVNVDQTTHTSAWIHYQVAEQAPAIATGISTRARFNPNTTGTAFFDDFTVEKMTSDNVNVITNGGFEDLSPAFWSPLNGTFGTDVFVATDNSSSGFNSFKITKTATGANAVGWVSDNNANLMWNGTSTGTISLHALVKTVGVNTAPANSDAKIGVVYTYTNAAGTVLSADTLWADQTAASVPWDTLAGVIILTDTATSVVAQLIMGKDATGSVYFDEVWNTFNSSAEEVDGWLSWYDASKGGNTRVTDTYAHGGLYSVEMFLPLETPVVAIDDPTGRSQVPNTYSLSQNYPNPFNPETTIEFATPRLGKVKIEVYNLLGKRVATLSDGLLPAGTYNIKWHAVDDRGLKVSSGIYFYTLTTNDSRITKKMLLLR